MSIEEFIELYGTKTIINREVPTNIENIYNTTAILIDD